MNKYSLKEFLEKKLEKYSSTLKNTSFDDTNKRYLCTDESTKNVYDYFSDSYTVQPKHIQILWIYCNKYKVQPHRLRMSTDFTIIQIPIFYEYVSEVV